MSSNVRSLVLDVGCGLNPRGDVNLDLYLDGRHREGGKQLRPEEIPRFVQGDALDMHFFKPRQFHTVKCYHLIEHFGAPECWDLMKELWRVTDKRLLIVCPHRYWIKFPRLTRSKNHLSHYDAKVFKKAIPLILGTHNFDVQTVFRGAFSTLIPFPLFAHLVRVEIWR